MVCGGDYHGGNKQMGCGHRFEFSGAAKYKRQGGGQAFEAIQIDEKQFEGEARKLQWADGGGGAGGRGGGGGGGGDGGGAEFSCDMCRKPLRGAMFQCIHCPSFEACQACDKDGLLEGQHTHGHSFVLVKGGEAVAGAVAGAGGGKKGGKK